MNNVVIKSVKKEDGPRIIEYFKSKRVDIREFTGDCYEGNGNTCIYYGVIDGIFQNYSLRQVEKHGAEIIELPDDYKVTWTRKQFKELHDIACITWKGRLIDMFQGFSTQDELEVTKEVYETMRDACTAYQRKVFDKIFGEDPFKTEVYFMCTKTLEERFVEGKKYGLITNMNDGYILKNEVGTQHHVSVGQWADYFYKID